MQQTPEGLEKNQPTTMQDAAKPLSPGYPPAGYPQQGMPLGTGYVTPGYGSGAPMPPPSITPGFPAIPGAAAVMAQMAHVRAEDIPRVENLSSLPKLWVSQRIDWLELFVDYDVSNTYDVYFSQESKTQKARWLLAKEESSFCARACIAPCREFSLDVGLPGAKQAGGSFEQQLGLVSSRHVYPMLRIHRPCFMPCCGQAFTIQDGSGTQIASGKESCLSACIPCVPISYSFFSGAKPADFDGPADYTMSGPCACWIHCIGACPCRDPFVFPASDASGRGIGSVSNVPNGCCKMCFTNADDYEVDFAQSASPHERGLLLAMSFLLDFRHFEQKQEKQQNNNIQI